MGEFKKALETYNLALVVVEAMLDREHPLVARIKVSLLFSHVPV